MTDYISEMSKKYAVLKIALDDFRYPLIRKALLSIGYDARTEKQGGNLVIVRPSAIMKVAPVVTSCFNRQLFAWGNNPGAAVGRRKHEAGATKSQDRRGHRKF